VRSFGRGGRFRAAAFLARAAMAGDAAARAAPPRRRAAGRATLAWAAALFALATWPAPAPPAFAGGATGGFGMVAGTPPRASPAARFAAKTAVAKAKTVAAKTASAKAAALGDVGAVTVVTLKHACQAAGLPSSGTKAVLLQRYLGALSLPELQAACRASGLKADAKKDGLIERLVEEAQSKAARKAKAKAATDAARAKSRYAKAMVARGTLAQTPGGLTKKDIVRSKSGKFVSKKQSEQGRASPWIKAVAAARKALQIKGFAVVGGKSKQGKELYAKAKSLM